MSDLRSSSRACPVRHRQMLALLALTCLLIAPTANMAHRHDRSGGPIDCTVCMLAHAPTTAAEATVGLPLDDGRQPLRSSVPLESWLLQLDRSTGSRAPPLPDRA